MVTMGLLLFMLLIVRTIHAVGFILDGQILANWDLIVECGTIWTCILLAVFYVKSRVE